MNDKQYTKMICQYQYTKLICQTRLIPTYEWALFLHPNWRRGIGKRVSGALVEVNKILPQLDKALTGKATKEDIKTIDASRKRIRKTQVKLAKLFETSGSLRKESKPKETSILGLIFAAVCIFYIFGPLIGGLLICSLGLLGPFAMPAGVVAGVAAGLGYGAWKLGKWLIRR